MVRSHIQLWRRRRRLPLRPPQRTPAPMPRCVARPTSPELALGTITDRVRAEEHRVVDLRAPKSPARPITLRRFEHPGVVGKQADRARCRQPPAACARPVVALQPPPRPAPRASRDRRRLLLLAAAIAVFAGVVTAALRGLAPPLEQPAAAESVPAPASEAPDR